MGGNADLESKFLFTRIRILLSLLIEVHNISLSLSYTVDTVVETLAAHDTSQRIPLPVAEPAVAILI